MSYIDGRANRYWSEQGLDIIRDHYLPSEQLDQLDVVNELLGVLDMMMVHQGLDDVG